MTTLNIAGRWIGTGQPTLIIAEIGVNHDGRLDRALELVHLASACGADAVKLQIFCARRLMHGSSEFAEYQKSREHASPTEMLEKYELSDAETKLLVQEIRRLNLIPLATPFSVEDVQTIQKLDLPAIKIASPDLVNWPLLKCAAETELPLLASTGAASMDEVKTTASWLQGWNAPFALLHCISSYPTPSEAANLCWIEELMKTIGVCTGFSDHTTETITGATAVSWGACIIERHLTYDRNATGPDHASSSDAKEFSEYVRLIRLAETLRGLPGKRVLEIEQNVRHVSRQSLVANRDLPAGTLLQETDLIVQRPGTGVPASELPAVIGKRTTAPLRRGEMLTRQLLRHAA